MTILEPAAMRLCLRSRLWRATSIALEVLLNRYRMLRLKTCLALSIGCNSAPPCSGFHIKLLQKSLSLLIGDGGSKCPWKMFPYALTERSKSLQHLLKTIKMVVEIVGEAV